MKKVLILHSIKDNLPADIRHIKKICRNLYNKQPELDFCVPGATILWYLDPENQIDVNMIFKKIHADALSLVREKSVDTIWVYGEDIEDWMHETIDLSLEESIDVVPKNFLIKTLLRRRHAFKN